MAPPGQCPRCSGIVGNDAIAGAIGQVNDWIAHPADKTTVDSVLEVAHCPWCGAWLRRTRSYTDELEPWELFGG